MPQKLRVLEISTAKKTIKNVRGEKEEEKSTLCLARSERSPAAAARKNYDDDPCHGFFLQNVVVDECGTM